MAFSTLLDLYKNSISKFGDLPCSSIYEGESLSYGEFAARVEQVHELLLNAGIVKGDKMALLSSNMPNWAVCYFATVTAGVVIVPILPDFSGEETDTIITHCEAKGLFVSDKLFGKLSETVTKGLNVVIRTKNLGVSSSRPCERTELSPPATQDLAAIIYTSGTTSAPKGVMLSHYNLCQQMVQAADLFPLYTTDVALSILPLSHTYECSLGMLYTFMRGTPVVYLDRAPTASVLMPAVKAVRPTFMLTVPLIMEKIYKSQIAARFSTNRVMKSLYSVVFIRKLIHRMAGKKLFNTFGGRLRFFGIGGAKLDRNAERFLLEGRFPYAIGYGLTESAPLIVAAVPSKVKLGSAGYTILDVQGRLDNCNPATGEGELVVKTPCAMMGYYKNPEATRDAFTADGWLRTKDLVFRSKNGRIYVRGRLNNMIIGPSGENIYPEDIESVINKHFLVADSIVRSDKGRLVALVQFDRERLEQKYQHLKEGWGYKMEEIKSDLIHYVNSKVNRFSKITAVIEQESDFKKTPTMKIKRFLYSGKRNKENNKDK